MTKAKLIKRGEIVKQKSSDGQTRKTQSLRQNVTKVVRDWIEERQQSRPAARKAFAALFANNQMEQSA